MSKKQAESEFENLYVVGGKNILHLPSRAEGGPLGPTEARLI